MNRWLKEKLETDAKLYEAIKNSDRYEPFVDQIQELKFPTNYGKEVKGMQLRPRLLSLKIDATNWNSSEKMLKELHSKIMQSFFEVRHNLSHSISIIEQQLHVHLYCNQIILCRYPLHGYISKQYDVVAIMDTRINKLGEEKEIKNDYYEYNTANS